MRRRGLRVVQHVWLDRLLWCWDCAVLVVLLLVEEVLPCRREAVQPLVPLLALLDGMQDDREGRVLLDVRVAVGLRAARAETVAAPFVVSILRLPGIRT